VWVWHTSGGRSGSPLHCVGVGHYWWSVREPTVWVWHTWSGSFLCGCGTLLVVDQGVLRVGVAHYWWSVLCMGVAHYWCSVRKSSVWVWHTTGVQSGSPLCGCGTLLVVGHGVHCVGVAHYWRYTSKLNKAFQ
jgi:uncharacterized membrane protein